MSELVIGAPAPSFALRDQRGEVVRLEALRGKKLLLYFYPRASTPG
jgi:thioredoxin-dependent peroxiredoxin